MSDPKQFDDKQKEIIKITVAQLKELRKQQKEYIRNDITSKRSDEVQAEIDNVRLKGFMALKENREEKLKNKNQDPSDDKQIALFNKKIAQLNLKLILHDIHHQNDLLGKFLYDQKNKLNEGAPIDVQKNNEIKLKNEELQKFFKEWKSEIDGMKKYLNKDEVKQFEKAYSEAVKGFDHSTERYKRFASDAEFKKFSDNMNAKMQQQKMGLPQPKTAPQEQTPQVESPKKHSPR